MEQDRGDPNEILRAIKDEASAQTRGRLKIFFGYAAGVGKTYAMLKAAHSAKSHGVNVLVGYIEPHTRPDTTALLSGLAQLPVLEISHSNITLREFDLDAAISAAPGLIIVDELAHSNAKGCRHTKRHQDIAELLTAGIDVYTTVNVQHIESLNDMVASVTGISVRERIPDTVFDNADQVELVDIEPEELISRLAAGKIYKETQAAKAMGNFFEVKNLVALREIALRRCADRVNKISEKQRRSADSDYYTDEHILVCLSSSPTNAKIIRTAARMANAFKGTFTALFVETADFAVMSEANKNVLRHNMHLAEQLGATIETVYGDDIPLQISEFARVSGVSKIVLGRNNATRKYFFGKPSLTEKLATTAPNLDIYIIPDKKASPYTPKKIKERYTQYAGRDILKSSAMLIAASILGYVFQELGFSEANIITVYILSVLITAIITTRRMYSLVAAIVSVLTFNFFFTVPRFTLNAYDAGYPATFLIMFISAFITSTLAVKIKQHARASSETAYRTKILLETNQLLQKSKARDEIVRVTANQLTKLLERNITFYLAENDELNPPQIFAAEGKEPDESCISTNEAAVAAWVYKNNRHAGATTNTLGNSKCLYLAVRAGDTVYGVVGVVIDHLPLESFENSIMLSILGESALALENEQVIKEREQAAIIAKNEQLRANLLRSISHDLRTPLTSISGNAGILLSSDKMIDASKKKQLYADIYDDSLWLINLVENLLSVTRIEDGSVNLHMEPELINEVIDEALRHINRNSAQHQIVPDYQGELLLARMDARLVVQVIINIVDNAIKYTPEGSIIKITAQRRGENVDVEISDNGVGIDEDAKAHIFEMFYTADNKLADSRRGMGLGLALCKSIITAHGGTISVTNNTPQGTIFTFSLPYEEVTLHE